MINYTNYRYSIYLWTYENISWPTFFGKCKQMFILYGEFLNSFEQRGKLKFVACFL